MDAVPAGPPERKDMLARFARLAARAAETAGAVIGVRQGASLIYVAYNLNEIEDYAAWFAAIDARGGAVTVVGDLALGTAAQRAIVAEPPYTRFIAHLPVRSPQGPMAGFLCVADPQPRAGLEPPLLAALKDIAGLLGHALEWERRHSQLLEVTNRAARMDRILRQVSEAASCAEALTSMLSELCEYHGAEVGRIWRLTADGLMQEVSRFSGVNTDPHAYYMAQPSEPVRAGNSNTAEAIRLNEPRAFNYSAITNVDQYVLLGAAIAAGLASQVSVPIWVQDQRFGISLAFSVERADLHAIVADIALLANSIRPALFRKVTEERIRFMALHDELTQLGNRAVLNERLAEAVAAAGGARIGMGDAGLALVYLDLDGFKLVNDSRGHEVGDKLLAAVAGRLRASVREGDTVARIGGDEFAIIQMVAGQPHAATQLARRLLQAVKQPFEIDGQPSMVGMSIGIALHPADGETPDVLQRNADAALYEAKQGGRNTFRLFEKSVGAMRRDQLLLERDLRLAIEREDLSLAYQPIVTSETRSLRGMEALLRWTHDTRGALPPGRFVPLAESSGMIVPLGRWVLQTACAEASNWANPISLSVNLSPMQFRQAGLSRHIETMLTRTGLAATRLDLEVTEGLLLGDSETVVRTMHELRDLGVHLTLDDFGTAFSGLGYLRRFPFDRIKIDQSFIQDMTTDDSTLAIVQAILSLSERLNLAVVAEGVETEEQLALLRRLGCPLVQGYLTGRPMGAAAANVVANSDGLQEVSGG